MPVTEWIRYDLGLPPVTDADLDSLEAARGVSLPPDFRDVMKNHAGDRPEPNVTTVGRASVPTAELFIVAADKSGPTTYSIWHVIEALDAYLPAEVASRLIPFTSDGGQALLVLDYRRGDVPAVSLVDLDIMGEPQAITVAAPDFATWLRQVRD